jgi:Nucleotidyltransferase of unknown function (DUF6036)
MTGKGSLVRTLDDLIETVRTISRLFQSEEVFIIESQSILLSWPDAPLIMRTSGEIDAYPGNARDWEVTRKALDPDDEPEASEEIAALLGEGSDFHKEHGFYIDGVDENTARLPHDWTQRAIYHPIDVDGRKVLAIAPCPEDIVVSKLARMSAKDKEFVIAYHRARALDPKLLEDRIEATNLDSAIAQRALGFIRSLTNAAS